MTQAQYCFWTNDRIDKYTLHINTIEKLALFLSEGATVRKVFALFITKKFPTRNYHQNFFAQKEPVIFCEDVQNISQKSLCFVLVSNPSLIIGTRQMCLTDAHR